jgi:signal transduction histidine kinase
MTSPRAAVRGLRPEAALGWGAAAAAVLVVYVVVVLGGGVLIGQTDSPHLGLSVLATAVVAAVAEPIRVRAEHAAARQLDRPLRSPYDVLAEFTHEVTGSDLVGEAPIVIARMLTQSIGVAWTQVWVLVHGRLQLMAAYPPGAGADEEPPTLFDTEAGDGLRAVTVAYAREPLGVLRVREQTGHLLTPVENRLLGGLAAQAGMVLQTAQLRAELAERLEQFTARELELRRARDDLVTTQDLARRQLERDLHDGAQQHLVALAINLQVGKALAVSDPGRARAVLQEQRLAVSEAVRTLRDLSSGLLPPELSHRGLVPALVAATTANPVPVRVSGPHLGRLGSDIESTLYFCALEAVQNATKHAAASRIDVRLDKDRGRVQLCVADDGVGIGVRAQGAGSGLANMRERAASVNGEIRVEQSAAGGTAVVVGVPATPTGTGRA